MIREVSVIRVLIFNKTKIMYHKYRMQRYQINLIFEINSYIYIKLLSKDWFKNTNYSFFLFYKK